LPLDEDTAVEQNTESSVTEIDTTSKDIGIQVDPAEFLVINITLMDLIKSDSDINSFTGLSKIGYLKDIAEISNILMAKLQYTIKFSLDIEIRICLTLCKLKLNMSYKSLSVLFGISDTSCKNYFIETINLLCTVSIYYKPLYFVRNPD